MARATVRVLDHSKGAPSAFFLQKKLHYELKEVFRLILNGLITRKKFPTQGELFNQILFDRAEP